ncbi:MAG: bifunctional heptose 7-phosphate kinase/heptose 1-phosphate adenyltransferase [Bacteroidales bacterium]
MDHQNIQEAFDAFNEQKILVIGDSMIDSYLWGDVERISPEAPVPVLTKTRRESRLGGAANVALNIKALGAEPLLASVIGNGEKADLFKKLLRDKILNKQGIYESNTRNTPIKTRIISHNQQLLRIDEELTDPLDSETEQAFLNHLLYIINNEKLNAIVFEDYDKGSITPLIIEKIVEYANKLRIPTLVDPKKRNYLFYKNVTLFKPNFKELVEGLNLTFLEKTDEEGILKAARIMHKEQIINWMLVTLSEAGIFISNNRDYKMIQAKIRDISDVSGAGDTIISIAAVGMAAGLSPWIIAELSNLGGGQVCEKAGIVPVNKKQLLEESQNHIPWQK